MRARMAELGGCEMGDIGLGLTYVLPRTEFAVDVVGRQVVAADGGQHWLRKVADVQVTTAAVADPEYRQTLWVDAGLLEKISLVVTLDDRGFITALNSEAGRDISPVISLAGKAVSVAAVLMGVLPIEPPSEPSLEEQWTKEHDELERLRTALTEQVKRLLDQAANSSTTVEELAQLGPALEAVQAQLATLSEARRAWIAGKATEGDQESWRLSPADLYRVNGTTLPDTLDVRSRDASPCVKEMMRKHGVLVAIADPDRAKKTTANEPMRRDTVALRRSRSVMIAVYTRDSETGWNMEPETLRSLDVVDDFSPTDPLSVDGSWWRMKKFELSYHPDMSLKSFGVSSSPNASAVATSTGDFLDVVAQTGKDIKAGPSDADKELAKAKTQLDLLKTASEYEVLAATKNQAAELAHLEQQKKIRESQS